VHGGQVYAIGLRNVEDVSVAELQQNPLILLGDVRLRFGVLLAARANDRGKNADILR
jgi:hypothetical protein